MLGDVCRLRRPRGRDVQWVIVLQDSLHDDLSTRLVAPLVRPEALARTPAGLHPMVDVDGQRWLVMMPLLASLPLTDLEPPLAHLADARRDLVAAIDLLVTGI